MILEEVLNILMLLIGISTGLFLAISFAYILLKLAKHLLDNLKNKQKPKKNNFIDLCSFDLIYEDNKDKIRLRSLINFRFNISEFKLIYIDSHINKFIEVDNTMDFEINTKNKFVNKKIFLIKFSKKLDICTYSGLCLYFFNEDDCKKKYNEIINNLNS